MGKGGGETFRPLGCPGAGVGGHASIPIGMDGTILQDGRNMKVAVATC